MLPDNCRDLELTIEDSAPLQTLAQEKPLQVYTALQEIQWWKRRKLETALFPDPVRRALSHLYTGFQQAERFDYYATSCSKSD